MMLLQSVSLHENTPFGRGLFATEEIPAGTVVWHPCNDCERYTVSSLSSDQLAYLDDKGYYLKNGDILLPCCNACFMNHHCQANVLDYGLDFGIAIRTIHPGEQITCDYRTWVDDPAWEMTCSCGSDHCLQTIEPNYGNDHAVQKYWFDKIFSILGDFRDLTQPLSHSLLQSSQIYKSLRANELQYSFPSQYSVRDVHG